MSQKNFASYGDMETLVTEIADKCGPYTEISYNDWLQLTPYQQEHGRWDVTDVPGADGTVSIDLMTKLWENPNPTSAFAAHDVTLANSDYDYLLVLAYSSASNSHILPCIIIKKGGNGSLLHEGNSGTAVSVRYRNVDYSSDTVLSIGDAKVFENGNSSWTTGNSFIIPYIIYGIKLHHTVEIKAIAPTVSTLAKNSVFNPTGTGLESTNAEDAIKELESNFQDGVDAVYDAVVAKGSTPASHSLSDVVDGIGAIPTGITPSGTLSITTNGTKDVTNYASADVQVPASAVVSGNKAITANGTNIDVTNYKTVSVSVANTVSAAVVAAFDVRSASSAYGFTRSSGYAYMIAVHTDDGTVGAYGIINSAGTIQSWQGATDYFSLTRNSATSFTLKKKSGDASWSGFIFRAL